MPATSGWCFMAHDSTIRCSHVGRSRIPSSHRTRALKPGTVTPTSTTRRSITLIRRGIKPVMARMIVIVLPKSCRTLLEILRDY